jgi:hypothetical protein
LKIAKFFLGITRFVWARVLGSIGELGGVGGLFKKIKFITWFGLFVDRVAYGKEMSRMQEEVHHL